MKREDVKGVGGEEEEGEGGGRWNHWNAFRSSR